MDFFYMGNTTMTLEGAIRNIGSFDEFEQRFTDKLLDVIKREDKLVKYLDIPLQHINGDILKKMNRKGDKDTLSALIDKIRNKIPEITLRTTLITGFPG